MIKGFTCGAFDVLHTGHILMFEEAKNHCDYLVVGLQTDPTIDRPNKNKPIQTVFERFQQLRAVRYIDEIVLYETEKELELLLQARAGDITVRFVDELYRHREFTAKHIDGIRIHYNTRGHTYSSTDLRDRLCK